MTVGVTLVALAMPVIVGRSTGAFERDCGYTRLLTAFAGNEALPLEALTPAQQVFWHGIDPFGPEARPAAYGKVLAEAEGGDVCAQLAVGLAEARRPESRETGTARIRRAAFKGHRLSMVAVLSMWNAHRSVSWPEAVYWKILSYL